MMSYDPSSLNRNKTLLEAIEEVKKFLIANPCYKVFYANTNYVIGTTTYSKTYIDDPDSIAEYDVVFFNNNYYGKVESVGDSTFTIIGATNFKGDTGTPGTPGTPGADGQDGISITNVSIDAYNHLICTLSDGNTIDAGEIPGGSIRIISLESGLSGTLTQDEYDKLVANDFNYVIEMGGIFYHKANLYGGGLDAHYTCIRKVSNTETWASDINIDSTRAWTLSTNVLRTKIQDGQIDSESASSGEVLTADGIGGASWQTPSGYQNSVSISTTSGTFTDSEFAKLGYGDSTIIYDDGTIKTTYKLKLETASILEFESIDASSKNNLKLIDVNKTTKAYSMTSVAMIKSATFDSGTATSGKVLTANGSGGTSWETAGGSSFTKYELNSVNLWSDVGNIFSNCKGRITGRFTFDIGVSNYRIQVPIGNAWVVSSILYIKGNAESSSANAGMFIVDIQINLTNGLLNAISATQIAPDGTITKHTYGNIFATNITYWNDTQLHT